MKKHINSYLSLEKNDLHKENRKIALLLLSIASILIVSVLIFKAISPEIQELANTSTEGGEVLGTETDYYTYDSVESFIADFDIDQKPDTYKESVEIYTEGFLPGLAKRLPTNFDKTVDTYCSSQPNPYKKESDEGTSESNEENNYPAEYKSLWDETNPGYIGAIFEDKELPLDILIEFNINKQEDIVAKLIDGAYKEGSISEAGDIIDAKIDPNIVNPVATHLKKYINKKSNECAKAIKDHYSSMSAIDDEKQVALGTSALKSNAEANFIASKTHGGDNDAPEDMVVGMAFTAPIKMIAQLALGQGAIMGTVGQCVNFGMETATKAIAESAAEGVKVKDAISSCPVIPSMLSIPKIMGFIDEIKSTTNPNLIYLPYMADPDGMTDYLNTVFMEKVIGNLNMEGKDPQQLYMIENLLRATIAGVIIPQMLDLTAQMAETPPTGPVELDIPNPDEANAEAISAAMEEHKEELTKLSTNAALRGTSYEQLELIRLLIINKYAVPVTEIAPIFNATLSPVPNALGQYMLPRDARYLEFFDLVDEYLSENQFSTPPKPYEYVKIPTYYLKNSIANIASMKIAVNVVLDAYTIDDNNSTLNASIDVPPIASATNINPSITFDIKANGISINQMRFNQENWYIPQEINIGNYSNMNINDSITIELNAAETLYTMDVINITFEDGEIRAIENEEELVSEEPLEIEKPEFNGYTYVVDLPLYPEIENLVTNIINNPDYQMPPSIDRIAVLTPGNEIIGWKEGHAGFEMKKIIDLESFDPEMVDKPTYRTEDEEELVIIMGEAAVELRIMPDIEW